MKIALTILMQNNLYYCAFEDTARVRVASSNDADVQVPGLDIPFDVHYDGARICITRNGLMDITGVLGSFLVVDNDSRLAVFCTEEILGVKSLKLPKNCEVSIGRVGKTSLGHENQVVVNLPFISSVHCSLTCTDGKIVLSDTQSKNGVYVNGKLVNSCVLNEGDVISVFTMRVTVKKGILYFENVGEKITFYPIKDLTARQGAPKKRYSAESRRFVRSPRLMSTIRAEVINIEKPPQMQGKPQINWVNVLLMPAISIGLMLVLTFVMNMNPIMMIMSGVTSVVSAIIAVVNYNNQKKRFEDKDELIDTKYHEYLSKITKRVESAKIRQLNALLSAHPAPYDCANILKNKARQLWERGIADEDFLSVRLGVGVVPAAVTAKYQQAQVVITESALEKAAKDLADKSLTIGGAPIVCDLAKNRLLGIVGSRVDELQVARNIVVELATAHSYDEVKIVVLAPEREISAWSWARWLLHCADNQHKRRFVYTSMEDAEGTLDEISDILVRRAAEAKDSYGSNNGISSPHYVFISAEPGILEKHAIKKYLFGDVDVGCSAVFVYDRIAALPKACGMIVEAISGNGMMYSRVDSNRRVDFNIDGFGVDQADKFARAMAPLYIDVEGSAAALPQSISFLEGYGVQSPEQLDVANRWRKSSVYKSLSVPIAKKADGESFCFDVHRGHHGTHGVVAGMTGSGKTEMVQSWLLSLALNFSPQDVSFVLIDFKGTALIAPFYKIPHLAGSISNLDTPSDIARNLIALRSEIFRREQLLDKYKDKSIKNINDLNKAYDKGNVPEKMPVLLVVIDEYAEFKKQYPEFGRTVDSLTQKGQALGIFVTLMAQKPAGIVSAQSEDNIRYRWCLRVANYSASREMLGRPDAAKISTPGRAFVKVGEDDVYEQVQSFWSGAPYQRGQQEVSAPKAPICAVTLDGKRTPYENIERRHAAQSDETQIDAVVRYIADYCKAAGVENAAKIWAEKLPERIALTELLQEGFDGTKWPSTPVCAPVIGLLDNPAMQTQYPLSLDFANTGHIVIYGAPTTGKTTLLKTMVMSVAMTRKPDETSVYIMDFGGWNLNVLKDLPHVGGIANDNEPERIKKLVALLQEQLEQRKVLFSRAGVGNITAYRDSTGQAIPDIILVIDNFGPVLKLYPDLEGFFSSLSSSGANYGVYMVTTASAANAVPTKITQNVKYCLTLQMIDKSDYTYLVGKVEEKLPPIMGRGFAKGTPPLEFQTALPTNGQDDRTISDHIRKIADVMNRSWTGNRPAMIPELPDVIPYGSVRTKDICLGLTCDKVIPVNFDLNAQHFLLISAASTGTRSNVLHLLGRQIKEKVTGKLFVFDPSENNAKLRALADRYICEATEIDSFVESMRPELQMRHAAKQNNPAAVFEPITIMVDDYAQFFQQVSNDTMARLNAIVKIGAGLGLYLIVADEAFALASMVNRSEPVALAMAKATVAMVLDGCLNDHGAIQTKATYAQKSETVKAMEGYFVSNGQPVRFKMMNAT